MGAEDLAFRATLDASGFTKGINDITSSLSKVTQGLPKDLEGLVGSIGKLGLGFAAGAVGVASFGAAIGQSISKASEYESVLNKIGKATGEGSKGLEGIQAAAHGTVFSMTEAAGAALKLSDTLKTNKEISAALPGTLFLAKQASMDLGSAVNTVTSAMKLFHQPATAAQADANLFIVAARASKTTVGELSSALSSAGPVAAQFGNSLASTTAALGVMISSGMKAENAGMALKTGLESLVTPSKQAAEAMASLGVSVKDLDPNLHSIDEIVATLGKTSMTASDAIQIFGNRAGPGMFALISQGSQGLEKFKSNLEGVNAATEAAKGGTETYAENMKKFGAACEEAEISIGNALLPALTDLISLMAQGVTGAVEMGQALSSWTVGTANTIAGPGSWFDSLLQGLIAYDEAISGGALADSGTIAADTWTESYEAEMRADTSEVDPYVQAAFNRQAQKMGADAGSVGGIAMVEGWEKVWDAQWGALQRSDSGSAGGPNTGWRSTTGTTSASGLNFKYGINEYYIMGGTNSTNAIQFPDGSIKQLTNSVNPAQDALKAANEWLQGKGQNTLTQAEAVELTTGLKLKFDASLWDTPFTQQNMSEWLNTNMEAAKNAGGKLGEALYNGYSENISKISSSPELTKSWNIVMDALAKPDPANAQRVSLALGDLVQSGIIAPKWEAEITKAATTSMSGIGDVITNAGQALKTKLGDFGSEAGKAFQDGILTQTEKDNLMGMGPALEQLKTQFPKEFDAVGGEAALALINALKNGDWPGAAKIVADAFGKPFVDNMTIWGTAGFKALSAQDLTSLLSDPNKLAGAVTDINKFSQNTLLPAIKTSMDEAKAAFKSGTWTDQQVYDSYIAPLEKYSQYLPPWMTQLKTALDSGKLNVSGFLNAYDQVSAYMDKTSSSIQTQTQQYNGLTTAINGTTAALNKYGNGNLIALSSQATPQPTGGQVSSTPQSYAWQYNPSTNQFKNQYGQTYSAGDYSRTTTGAIQDKSGNTFSASELQPVGGQVMRLPIGTSAAPTSVKTVNPSGSSSNFSTSNIMPVVVVNPMGQAYTASNPMPTLASPASSSTGGIINYSKNTSPYYSDYYWAGDYGEPNITPPTSAFQSSWRRGTVPIIQQGSPPVNPWTNEPIMSINQAAVQATYGGKSQVMPSTDLLNPMVTQNQAYTTSAIQATQANQKVAGSLISATAEDGKFCEAMSEFGMKQEQRMGLFKQSSITFTDSLTPAQRELYNTSENLKQFTADDGKYCEAVSDFTIKQEDALNKVDTSFIGTTDAYNAFKNATDDTKLHIMSVTPEVKNLGMGLGTIVGNTQQLGQSNGQLGTSQGVVINGNRLLIDSNGNLINSQYLVASINQIISEQACEQALEQADAYGNVSLGTQAVVNDLAKLTAENGKFCEAISDFGLAQENTMGIFKQSYIGPTATNPYAEPTNALGKLANDIQDASKAAYDLTISGSDYNYENQNRVVDSWRSAGDSINANLAILSNDFGGVGSSIKAAGDSVQVSSNQAKTTWTGIDNSSKANWDSILLASLTSGNTTANYWGTSVKTSADYWVGNTVTAGNYMSGGKSTYTAGTSPGFVNGTFQAGTVGTINVVYPTSYNVATGVVVTGGVGQWGGTSNVTGSGGWIGTGTTAGNPAFTGGSTPSWGGAATSTTAAGGGHGSVGGVAWAEGGLVTQPTYSLIGENGNELVLPLNDKKRTKDLLNQYLSIQAFASGGIIGSSSQNGQTLITVSFTDLIDSIVYGSSQFLKNMKESSLTWNTGLDEGITKLNSCWSQLETILGSMGSSQTATVAGGGGELPSNWDQIGTIGTGENAGKTLTSIGYLDMSETARSGHLFGNPFIASGGYINYQPGGTQATIGEAGDEYVVPSQGTLVLRGGSSKPSVTIHIDYHPEIPAGLDKAEIQALLQEDRQSLVEEIQNKITEAY